MHHKLDSLKEKQKKFDFPRVSFFFSRNYMFNFFPQGLIREV